MPIPQNPSPNPKANHTEASVSQLLTWVDSIPDLGTDDDQSVSMSTLEDLHGIYKCLDLMERVWPTEENSIRVGPYQLEKEIGRGGMGSVWSAQQLEPIKRRLAIKLIKPGLPSDSDQVAKRFESERNALALMNHPNVSAIIDAGTTDDGQLFFAMELINGPNLISYCNKNQLNLTQRLNLFLDACSAVQHAHQHGVIHRDLKPGNILIGEVDGKPLLKVIDFGLSKIRGSAGETAFAAGPASDDAPLDQVATRLGKVVGSVRYMSPEQTTGDSRNIDNRTDIYSLGIVLFKLLTDSIPLDDDAYSENSSEEIFDTIRNKREPSPSEWLSRQSKVELDLVLKNRKAPAKLYLKQLREDLDWIVKRAIEKDRDDRYATVSEFASDLNRFLNHEPVLARPHSSRYTIGKLVSKHRGVVTAVSTAMLLLVLGIVGTTIGMLRAERNAERATALLNENEKVLARSNFSLANARWDANRALEANEFLELIPHHHRGFEWQLAKRQFCGSDMVLYGHRSPVYGVAFSRTGDRILSGSLDGSVRIWDGTTGEMQQVILLNKGSVMCACFSPDEKQIVAGTDDRNLYVVDAENGEVKIELSGHAGRIACVCYSPDGKLIVSGSLDQTVRIWDSQTGELLDTLTDFDNQVSSIAFHPDGKQMVTASGNQHTDFRAGNVKVWDVEKRNAVRRLNKQAEPFLAVAFSPDGSQILAAGGEGDTVQPSGDLKLWDAESGELINSFKGHSNWISCVTFSPDGSRIASGAWDRTVRLWDVTSGNEIKSLTGSSGSVHCISFNHDGSRLVSGGDVLMADGVRVWDTKRVEQARSLDSGRESVEGIEYFPDGSRIAAASGKFIDVWDLEKGTLIQSIESDQDTIRSLSVSPDGLWIASGGRDKTVCIWDAESGERRHVLRGHIEPLISVQFSPSGKRVVSSSGLYPRAGTIRVWNVASGEEELRIDAHPKNINGVRFSPDESIIASASEDKTIKLWNAQTGALLNTLKGHQSFVHCVEFSPDGLRIATGGGGKVKIWDVATGSLLGTLDGHTGYVTSVCFSPDGSRLASGSYDRSVRLWDADSFEELTAIRGHSQIVFSIKFSPDGRQLASSSGDGLIKLFDSEMSASPELRKLSGHTSDVTGVALSADGKRLFSGSANEQLVWDTQTGLVIPRADWSSAALSKTARSDRWMAFSKGNNIWLVDREFKNTEREMAFRRFKARPDLAWHRRRFVEMQSRNLLAAAAFHGEQLVKLEPDNVDNQNDLDMVRELMRDQAQ